MKVPLMSQHFKCPNQVVFPLKPTGKGVDLGKKLCFSNLESFHGGTRQNSTPGNIIIRRTLGGYMLDRPKSNRGHRRNFNCCDHLEEISEIKGSTILLWSPSRIVSNKN